MNLPEDFIFSQSSLQGYVDCPRRFQMRYLQRQRWPAPEVEEILQYEQRMAQGEQFHHLVHQHLVGIPDSLLLKRLEDSAVRTWFQTYLATGLTDLPEDLRPESTMTVPLGDFALAARFDLLAIQPGQRAVIMDWKTGQHIPAREHLASRLQTIVYRYVLAKGGAYANGGKTIPPEQIEMVYWYAQHSGKTLRFAYSAAQMAADETYLLALLAEINTRPDFPLTVDDSRCRYCVYRSLWDRGREAGPIDAWDEDTESLESFTIDLDQIGEIAY